MRPRRLLGCLGRPLAIVGGLLSLLGVGCDGGRIERSRMPVVLVVLDATRADHLGAYGYARDTTPRIDAFATESVRYETAISDASFTFLAIGSLMSARAPWETGLSGRSGGRVPAEIELLAEVARGSGFSTGAYSENPHVTRYFGLDQGFDYFEEAFPVADYLKGDEFAEGHDSRMAIRTLLDRVDADRGRPFFAYIHLLRPHNPYRPTPPFAGRFGSRRAEQDLGSTESLAALDARGPPFDADALDRIVELYDENLAQADSLFGFLLDELAQRDLASKAIVILTADHGEAFGEHGRLLHSTQVYDPMIKIPMIVRVPGERPRIEPEAVQLSDLGRALQRYLRSPDQPGALEPVVDLARSRRQPESERAPALFSWTNASSHLVSVRTATRKLVLDARSLAPVAYHDLVADPQERRPIPLDGEGRALRTLLERRIASWTGAAPAREEIGALDAETIRRLEALGYAASESEKDVADAGGARAHDPGRTSAAR